MKTKTLKVHLSILVAFSFALSSCDKKDAILVNRRTATSERIKEVRVNASSLIKSLYAEGRPDKEIEGFVQLENEREYLGSSLGEIVRIGNHFLYRVNGKDYSGAQTTNSCGIWAVRRKLRHMYHLGTYGIHEDAWYRCSDEGMRRIIANVYKNEHASRTGEMLYVDEIIRLQVKFGVNEDISVVHDFSYSDNTKEALCVYNPESENNDSDEVCLEGGNFHGFNYDSYGSLGLGCRVYCKLFSPTTMPASASSPKTTPPPPASPSTTATMPSPPNAMPVPLPSKPASPPTSPPPSSEFVAQTI